MYTSTLDASGSLAFAFDPLRTFHSHEDSQLQWPEFPYKQVTIDRVRTKTLGQTKPSVAAAAGALLIALGDETRAVFELQQHQRGDDDGECECDMGQWEAFETRFTDERAAFRDAKKRYLLEQKAAVASILGGIASRKQEEAERAAHEVWKKRQIIKRFPDGSKYEGDGLTADGVSVPHGHGTLWVPEKPLHGVTANLVDTRRVTRYIGEWMDGFMHGRGTYYWESGDSWEGNFIRSKMQGKGVYTIGAAGDCEDADRPNMVHGVQRARFYNAGVHVCWGDDLVPGCRLRVFENQRGGMFSVGSAPLDARDREGELMAMECVIVSHDERTDRHLVRKDCSEDTRWVSLHNSRFVLASSRPITRVEPS